MITLDNTIVGVWNILMEESDWLAAINEIEPDVKYKLTYRWRYIKDEKIFDSKDIKRWYEAEVGGTKAFCIASLRTVGCQLAMASKSKLNEMLNEDNDLPKFMERLADMPGMYVRIEHRKGTNG